MNELSVGVDVGGTTIQAVMFDDALTPVAVESSPTPRGGDAILDAIWASVAALTDGHAPDTVAVGIPGRVDVAEGTVRTAVNLGISGPVAVRDRLQGRLGVPVHVENDVNAAALGAFALLRMESAASLAYVNVGTGIAAGFVVGGRLLRGATGGAGEIGHIPMRPDGPPCPCGQVGCAEAVGSGRAVSAEAATDGDVIAAVAWAAQLCVMTLDVDVVVVGGGMTSAGDPFQRRLVDTLAKAEAASPMLAATGLARRVRLAPVDDPRGSLGAVLAARDPEVSPWAASPS
jgi:predicted NBD/HSP70 family sugar kinase